VPLTLSRESFNLPRSTLLMLVSAFAGRELVL
jgi:S-adenosylmethionine:tRNA-ribosyltransferase-isomerase (queuine synthetase)